MKKRVLLTMMMVLALVLTACGGNDASSTAAEGPVVLEGTSTAGMGGEESPLKVQVTKDGDTITKVEVVEHGETDSISDPAIEQIPAAIVENNGTEGVDVVSGATLTSNAIIEAVNNALAAQ